MGLLVGWWVRWLVGRYVRRLLVLSVGWSGHRLDDWLIYHLTI